LRVFVLETFTLRVTYTDGTYAILLSEESESLRRVLWTVGVGLVGFGLGWFGQQGHPLDLALLATVSVWGICVGYGFGVIFDQDAPSRRLVIYWAITLALGALLFSGFVPFRSFQAKLATAAAVGAFLGALAGALHLWQIRRTLRARPHTIASPSSPVT
jgi:hypothetical protein